MHTDDNFDAEETTPSDDGNDSHCDSTLLDKPQASECRVSVIQSPVLSTFYHQHPVRLTLDIGATTNMIQGSFAEAIDLPISPASEMVSPPWML